MRAAFVTEAFARRIVGRRVPPAARAGFALDAPGRAPHGRRPAGGGLGHRRDRGARHRPIERPGRLATAGVAPSLGSLGGSRGEALAGTVAGLSEAEARRRSRPWRDLGAVALATLGWVGWSNHRRPLEPTGNTPPAEAEARYRASSGETALAAQAAKPNRLREARRGSARRHRRS